MHSWVNHILSKNQLDSLSKDLFVFFHTKDQILENLQMQEKMKKWVLHYLTDAKSKGISSVDVKVWSESGWSILWSSNQLLIDWLNQEGYDACINQEKTVIVPIPFTKEVFLTITIASDK
jgi:hypothetical protein